MINDIGGANSANAAIKSGNLAMLEIHKIDRIIAAGIVGGTASVISGSKFANGAVTGALAQIYNGDATSEKEILRRNAIKAKYEALSARIEKFAKDNPDSLIPITTEELQLIADRMTIRAIESHSFYIFEDSVRGIFGNFDTFIYTSTINLTNRDFIWDGGIYKGGNINYIGVGALFREYWIPIGVVDITNMGWNAKQWYDGEGSHNATQWFYAMPWTRVGYFNDIKSYGHISIGQGIVR